MTRKLHEPFTLPDHPGLIHKINEMSIAIKLHYLKPTSKNPDMESDEKWEKAKEGVMKPTWENIIDLLCECHQVINEKRHNPIKY